MKNNIFRAWQNGSMSKAFDLKDIQNGVMVLKDDSVVVGFTGRLDSNGVRIFEGDIVKYVRKNVALRNEVCPSIVFIGEVFWSDEKYAYQYTHKFESGSSTTASIEFNDTRASEKFIEVVGNIYENPTLLEVLQNNLYGIGEHL